MPSTVRWSLHSLKVFQPLSESKSMIQVPLAQFVTLAVTAGSEELLKQLLEAHVMVYSSSAGTWLFPTQMGMFPSAGFVVNGKMYLWKQETNLENLAGK